MTFKSKIWAPIAVVVACLATPAMGQEFGEVTEQFRRNLEALNGYAWKSEVQYEINGQLKSTEHYRVSYNDGKLTRELTDAEGKANKDTGLAKTTLASIRSLIDGYTHMKPEALRKAFGDQPRTVTEEADSGLTRITVDGVISVGSTMTIWVDSLSYRMRKLEIETQAGKERAHVLAEFEDLDGGAIYATRSTLRTKHKKKQIKMITRNSDPVRSGG